jgi:hypothetical protein
LTGPIGLVLPPLRQQTICDVLLQRARFFDERVELPEERSQFLGGEKALLAHDDPLSRRIANARPREKQSRMRDTAGLSRNGITLAFKMSGGPW